jgi:hypothetical protein
MDAVKVEGGGAQRVATVRALVSGGVAGNIIHSTQHSI